MAHTRRGFGGKEIGGRSLKELQHRCVFERWRVRHVDDDGRTAEDLGQSLPVMVLTPVSGDAGTH